MDYTRFSDDIESIFTTKGLEKKPTAQVRPWSMHMIGMAKFMNFDDTI